jgi:hypothetical protein
MTTADNRLVQESSGHYYDLCGAGPESKCIPRSHGRLATIAPRGAPAQCRLLPSHRRRAATCPGVSITRRNVSGLSRTQLWRAKCTGCETTPSHGISRNVTTVSAPLLVLEICSVTVKPQKSGPEFWFTAGRRLRILSATSEREPFLAVTDEGQLVSCVDAVTEFQDPLACLGPEARWQAQLRDLAQRAGCIAAIARVTPKPMNPHARIGHAGSHPLNLNLNLVTPSPRCLPGYRRLNPADDPR